MDLDQLVDQLRSTPGIVDKQDIQTAAAALGQYVQAPGGRVRLGDDCAAIPDGDGYLLLAAEGMWPQLVEQDPWFAGWCAIMVNLSDIAAMGGTATAVVDALWSQSEAVSEPLWQGLQAASRAYGVPIVGGHTNCHSPHAGLAVAVLGRARQLLTSFSACPGDVLAVVLNMGGSYYGRYPFWNAATAAAPATLQQHLGLLPKLAATGLCKTAKDISMGGLAGTLLMLAEASSVGAWLDLDRVPKPAEVPWQRWLTSFPSFGFLLSLPPENLTTTQTLFTDHGLVCEAVGEITAADDVVLRAAGSQRVLWEMARPLTGFGRFP